MCPTAATLHAPAHQPPSPLAARAPAGAPQPSGEPLSADGRRVSEET